MLRKGTIYLTFICFIVCIHGCTSRYAATSEELERRGVHRNIIVETFDGEVYDFGVIHAHGEHIVGCVGDSILVNVELEDVESVRVLKFDALKTVWYTLAIAVGVFVRVLF